MGTEPFVIKGRLSEMCSDNMKIGYYFNHYRHIEHVYILYVRNVIASNSVSTYINGYHIEVMQDRKKAL